MTITSASQVTAHPVVDRAVGVIQARNRCDAEAALEILHATALRHKLDLVELAREVVIVGGLESAGSH